MSGRRIVYGIGPVRELMRKGARDIDCLFVSEKRLAKKGDPVNEIAADAKNCSMSWTVVGNPELDRLAKGAQHQGVVAIAGAFAYRNLHDIVASASKPGLLVALDGVTDPHNLGAIMRSALLLGADGLLLPKDRSAKVTALVTKTSAGASEHLPIAQVTNLVRSLEELKEDGYWSVAVASGPRAVPLQSIDSSMPLVVVLGSEGKGIRPLVGKVCDFHAEIPMAATAIGSFNVSVAAAITLYELTRTRA